MGWPRSWGIQSSCFAGPGHEMLRKIPALASREGCSQSDTKDGVTDGTHCSGQRQRPSALNSLDGAPNSQIVPGTCTRTFIKRITKAVYLSDVNDRPDAGPRQASA